MINKNKKFAFWKYDKFPYVLGSEITLTDDYGKVETKDYGEGNYFRPIMIVSLKKGKKLSNKLREIKIERDIMMNNIHNLFQCRLENEFPARFAKF